MLWHALDSAQEFGSLYRSADGRWYIRHYVEGKGELGFGIQCARAYRVGEVGKWAMREFTGERALEQAQVWCEGESKREAVVDSTKGRAA